MLIRAMQESKFLQEFCSSSGMQEKKKKKRLRRLPIRPAGVRRAVASNIFFFLLFFSISQGFYHDHLLQGYGYGLLHLGPSPEEAVPGGSAAWLLNP